MEKLPRAECSPEFREQAIRTDQESGLSNGWGCKANVAAEIIAESLGDGCQERQIGVSWQESEADQRTRNGATQTYTGMGGNKNLARFPEKVLGEFREGVAVKYRQIASMRHNDPVELIFRCLGYQNLVVALRRISTIPKPYFLTYAVLHQDVEQQ